MSPTIVPTKTKGKTKTRRKSRSARAETERRNSQKGNGPMSFADRGDGHEVSDMISRVIVPAVSQTTRPIAG
jgi:hypothetical protein